MRTKGVTYARNLLRIHTVYCTVSILYSFASFDQCSCQVLLRCEAGGGGWVFLELRWKGQTGQIYLSALKHMLSCSKYYNVGWHCKINQSEYTFYSSCIPHLLFLPLKETIMFCWNLSMGLSFVGMGSPLLSLHLMPPSLLQLLRFKNWSRSPF